MCACVCVCLFVFVSVVASSTQYNSFEQVVLTLSLHAHQGDILGQNAVGVDTCRPHVVKLHGGARFPVHGLPADLPLAIAFHHKSHENGLC